MVEEKQPNGSSFFPKLSSTQAPVQEYFKEKQVQDSEAPIFIIEAFKAKIDQIEDTTMGRDLDGSFSPGHSTCRLPLAGQQRSDPAFWETWPLPHPPHSSVPKVSDQAKPQG